MENLLLIYSELLKQSWFLYLNLTFAGLIAGSFCTMLIHRLPLIIHLQDPSIPIATMAKYKAHHKDLSLSFPASHCPVCGKKIPIYLNLPLLGYLFARGKCSKCGEQIPWYYPITEILCLFAALVAGWSLGTSPVLLPLLFLLWALITLSMIDLLSGLLPDKLTLGILWVGLIFHALSHSLGASYIPYASIYQAIIGVVVSYASLNLVNFLYYMIRGRMGIGGGDIKLFAGLAAYFGWQGLLPLLFIASISGIVFFLASAIFIKDTGKSKDTKYNVMLTEQQWGPHIALAAVVYLLLFHLQPELLQLFIPV